MFTPGGEHSPLGTNFTLGARGEVKNGPLINNDHAIITPRGRGEHTLLLRRMEGRTEDILP
jgi:hypothetical protein